MVLVILALVLLAAMAVVIRIPHRDPEPVMAAPPRPPVAKVEPTPPAPVEASRRKRTPSSIPIVPSVSEHAEELRRSRPAR